MDLHQAQQEFEPDTVFLNTASLGLPPRRTVRVLTEALREWQRGEADPAAYDADVDRARRSYGGLVGVPVDRVAIGHQVSPLVGLVAASVPDGAEIVVADGDFTSVTYPFLAQASRGVEVRAAALEGIAGALTERTHLVAVSMVQSADGRLLDADALTESAGDTGTRTLVDLTQATGWLPVDAGRFDYTRVWRLQVAARPARNRVPHRAPRPAR